MAMTLRPVPTPSSTLARIPHALARSVSEASSSASRPTSSSERQAVKSEAKTLSAGALMSFDNSSGVTINAIIIMVGVLFGVFLLCIIISFILQKTNAPRQEAFPYSQVAPIQPAMFQPSASVRPQSDISAGSKTSLVDRTALLRSAAPVGAQEDTASSKFAGNATLHGRSGSSGVGLPGQGAVSQRGAKGRLTGFQQPSPLSDQTWSDPATPSPSPFDHFISEGAINYNGRDMTINMAGPEADEGARQAAERRLERERARRSTVTGGPPPAMNGKRASKYRMSTGSRLSVGGAKAPRHSRLSRVSHFFGNTPEEGFHGNTSSRRRTVTSTGPGVYRPMSLRCDRDEGDFMGIDGYGSGRHGPAVRQSRIGAPPPRNRQSYLPGLKRASTMSSVESMSLYQSPSVYTSRDSLTPAHWTSLRPQQNVSDPLQIHGPSPFVLAHA